ncbi:hypothetical protein [Streptomyces sp. MZ04]|uniref:hypothetical protein n=1 Tax=Streptomyces sp. MZ04 TaxID=2559236 RepID=UPI00107EC4C8|nr:hypothetical protein [Streptomyces sp. MZ04]TGB00583.1 hypothetical protein E2651_28790 [Streptomyces sp. MZ04]
MSPTEIGTLAIAAIAIIGGFLGAYFQGHNVADGTIKAATKTADAAYRAAVDSAKEQAREGHAQWQRDRSQTIWADYTKALDILRTLEITESCTAAEDRLHGAYAMVELMSPPGVLVAAKEAKDAALCLASSLVAVRHAESRRRSVQSTYKTLRTFAEQIQGMGRDASGRPYEELEDDEYGNRQVGTPSSDEQFQQMNRTIDAGEAAREALDALRALSSSPHSQEAERRGRKALTAAARLVPLRAAGAVIEYAKGDDGNGEREALTGARNDLKDARDVFVAEARKELDALGR